MREDERDPEFYDIDRLQAAVKDWGYRNFGDPAESRSVMVDRLLDALDASVDPSNPKSKTSETWKEIVALAQAVREAPEVSSTRTLLGVGEEAGELMHAHLKTLQGIRLTSEEGREKKKDAVGDIIVYLAHYCSEEDISLYECIERAWGEVRERDWKANPQTGKANVDA